MHRNTSTDFICTMFGPAVAMQMVRAKDMRPAAEFMPIAQLVDAHGFAPDITVGELRAMAETNRRA